MHSRLYRRVLNKYHWMANCAAFSSLYNDTGLVGIVASAESSQAEKGLHVLIDELKVRRPYSHSLCSLIVRRHAVHQPHQEPRGSAAISPQLGDVLSASLSCGMG